AWAGPTCSRLLGDFGADVIKVESMTAPDISRIVGPFPNGEYDPDCSGNFLEWFRNKRSVTLDLKDERQRDVALRLAAEVDVVTHNFSPPAIPALPLRHAHTSA